MKLSEAITVIREEFVKLRSGVYRMDSVAEALSDFDRACAAAVRRWNEPGQRVKLMRIETQADLRTAVKRHKEWRDRTKRIDAILEASR